MDDGESKYLGHEAVKAAIDKINADSTKQLLKFLKWETHYGSSWRQLRDNHWEPYCEDPRLSRHEDGGNVNVVRLSEEEKEYVLTDEDRDRIIQVMMAFCIFSKPADKKPTKNGTRKI